ncbi:MAG: PD-(D/E)XK nuclease family protein [Rhizonema sp. NSF051]|nr:PD-(D/E)XK nuclease family protein [Rhizonema sp. NSF051]
MQQIDARNLPDRRFCPASFAQMLEFVEKSEHNFKQSAKYLPFNPNFSEERRVGRQFHLLMQQLMMGLPVEPFLETYPEMDHWVNQLYPIISSPTQKQCNVNKGKLIKDWYLIAHYDLLIEEAEKVITVDWKTGKYIPENLEDLWQTQLRLFILAETQDIPAENIFIIYCFVSEDEFPCLYQFNYSLEKHETFIERLAMTLSKLPTNNSEESFSSNLHVETSEYSLNLQKLFKGEMSTSEYLATIPEVEI